MKNVSRDRVDILVGQRLRRVLRHGATDVVEQRRCVWPITADGTHGLGRREGPLPSDKPVADAALAFLTMTGGTLLLEHLSAAADRASAWRQPAAVASNVDIPAGNFGRRRNAAYSIRALCLRVSGACESGGHEGGDGAPTQRHC